MSVIFIQLHLVKPLLVFGVEGFSFPLPEKCVLIQCHQVTYCTSYKSNLLATLIIMTKTMMIMTVQLIYYNKTIYKKNNIVISCFSSFLLSVGCDL